MRPLDMRRTTELKQSISTDPPYTEPPARPALRHRFANLVAMMFIASLLAPTRALAVSEQVLWNFGLYNGDGQGPNGGLIMDASGNLLGTTLGGGSNGGAGSQLFGGTIFKVTPTGEESILWNFGGSAGGILFGPLDGQVPVGGLLMDASGNLYGATGAGGLYDQGPYSTDSGGTVFEFSAAGQESVLWNFGNGADGVAPEAGLIADANGNFFGTTAGGGVYGANANNSGTAFELTSAGQESVLWNFGNGTDGAVPLSKLIMDASGNLYGTTSYGGLFGPPVPPFKRSGILFKLTPSAAPAANGVSKTLWTESILWNFGNGADGQNPNSLIMDGNGNFFGTTAAGGANNAGAVFEVTAAGQESVLWNFGAGTDGQVPNGVIMDAGGNLYGTTSGGGTFTNCGTVFPGCGIVFKLAPPTESGGNWTETILWNFGNGTDGADPQSPLLMDASGNLFGATTAGGTNLTGTVYELTNVNSSGQISLSSQHIQFPKTSVGGASSYQLAIRNTGTGQLSGTLATPPAPFGLQGSGSFNLAPHTQTKITLTFKPAAADRVHQRATITSTSVKQNSIQLDLRGIGTAPASPALALNEAPR